MKKRSWILGLLLALSVAAVCVRLGFWQLDRLAQRRAYNATVAASIDRPPLDLDAAAVAAIRKDPGSLLYRRAVAEGRFVPGTDVILRGRSQFGQPGVHLVAAMRLSGGPLVLVNRGWVPSPDATTVDPREYRSTGHVRIVGILEQMPPPDAEAAPVSIELADTSVVTYRRLTAEALAPRIPAGELPDLYLQALPDTDGAASPPIPIPAPTLDEGPHLGYAIQWFSFAAIAVGGFLVTAMIRRKHAR